MVINLEGILHHEKQFDITVQPGDKLVIRRRPEAVTVIGEVYHPTSHLVLETLTRNEYIRLSGGVTERGNKGTIYVVHADGAVEPTRGRRGGKKKMHPGDTIVVPLKIDRINKLKLATDIAQIIFSLAFTAAAINSLSN